MSDPKILLSEFENSVNRGYIDIISIPFSNVIRTVNDLYFKNICWLRPHNVHNVFLDSA